MAEKIKNKKIYNNEEIEAKISVFRSNTRILAQVIDIKSANVIAVSSSNEIKSKAKKVEIAFETGKLLAQKLTNQKFKRIYFDRCGYKYHGRVKALADGARSGGLKF